MFDNQSPSLYSSNHTNTRIQALERKANDLESTAHWMLKEVASLRQGITTLKQFNQRPTISSKPLDMWNVSKQSLECRGLCSTSNKAVNSHSTYQAPHEDAHSSNKLNLLDSIALEHLPELASEYFQCQDTTYTDLDISTGMYSTASDSLSCTTKQLGAVSTNSGNTPKSLEKPHDNNSVAESAPLERKKAEASTTTENIAKQLPPISSFISDDISVSINGENAQNAQNAQQIPAFNNPGIWISSQELAISEPSTIRDNRADNRVTTTQVVSNIPNFEKGNEALYHTQNYEKPIEKTVEIKRGRPRKADSAQLSQSQLKPQQRMNNRSAIFLSRPVPISSKILPLYRFIISQLNDQNNHDIEWTDIVNGYFKVKNPKSISKNWGDYKNNAEMNWEKLSRSLRLYEKTGLLINQPGKRLSFQFNNHHPYMKNQFNSYNPYM